MKSKAPEQTNPPDSTTETPKKVRAKKLAPPINLAGGVPADRPITSGEKRADVDAGVQASPKEVPGVAADHAAMVDALGVMGTTPTTESEKAVATTDAASPKVNVPQISSANEVAPEDAATAGIDVDTRQPMTSNISAAPEEQGMTFADAPADATTPNLVAVKPEGRQAVPPADVQTEFEAECQTIRRRIVAHEISYAMGWYPIADALADLKQRYAGRLQNLAVGIGDAIGRSERFVYLLLRIAEHPTELRARVREVGMGDDQGRLLQLTNLDAEEREHALEAFGEGGPKAFDAVVAGAAAPTAGAKAATPSPALESFLAQFSDPKAPFACIASADPKKLLPTTITKQLPELAGKTYGDALKMSTAPSTRQSGGAEEKPSRTEASKQKPNRDWGKAFDLAMAAEREVALRKATFTLTIVSVVDADGNEIKGATAKIQVLDRT